MLLVRRDREAGTTGPAECAGSPRPDPTAVAADSDTAYGCLSVSRRSAGG